MQGAPQTQKAFIAAFRITTARTAIPGLSVTTLVLTPSRFQYQS